jgi:hypothetical protein
MTTYALKAPSGFKARPGVLEALGEIFGGAGVPPQAAQTILDKTIGWFDQQERAADAAGQRDLDAAMRNAWGADADRKLYVARQAARTMALDPAAAAVLEAALGGSFPMIELFHRIGEKLEAMETSSALASSSPRGESPRSPAATQSPTTTGDQGMTLAGLERKLIELKADRNWVEAYTDPLHPRNQLAKEEFAALCTRVAEARAVEASAARTEVVVKRPTARQEFERDPKVLEALFDFRHPQHEDYARRHRALMEAEIPAGPDMGALRRDLDLLTTDPDNRRAIMDKSHPRHAEVAARRARVIEDHLAAGAPSSSGIPRELPPPPTASAGSAGPQAQA